MANAELRWGFTGLPVGVPVVDQRLVRVLGGEVSTLAYWP